MSFCTILDLLVLMANASLQEFFDTGFSVMDGERLVGWQAVGFCTPVFLANMFFFSFLLGVFNVLD